MINISKKSKYLLTAVNTARALSMLALILCFGGLWLYEIARKKEKNIG